MLILHNVSVDVKIYYCNVKLFIFYSIFFNLFSLCSTNKNNFDKWLLLMNIILFIKQISSPTFFVFLQTKKNKKKNIKHICVVLPVKDVGSTKLFQELYELSEYNCCFHHFSIEPFVIWIRGIDWHPVFMPMEDYGMKN